MHKTKFNLIQSAAFLLIAMTSIVGAQALAATPLKLTFETHAAFFSSETKQPKAIDPEVFVQDAAAKAATGPQGIKHVNGVRPAFIAQDPKSSKLFNADDKPLGFTLGQWLGASGSVSITLTKDGRAIVKADFKGLRPGGRYSLFENHFDQKPIGFTPLDGAGKTNSFTAQKNGAARVTVAAPKMLTHANAVLLVYHSDGKAHGALRGAIGINAHHQLIARIPKK